MRKRLPFSVLGLMVTAIALPVMASFHLMKVVEIFPGTPASPNAQYVVIQMYTSGQNLVSGHAITVFNAAGTQVGTFTFSGSVPNAASQDKILIATTQAASFFNLTPDLIMSSSVISAGGKVCFDSIDCVAWGSYAGSATGVGTPYHVSQGLTSGKAAIRRLDISGSASVLDAADDTNNCANDFIEGLPAPENNSRISGSIPAATCGNGAIEGLEQCDDNNTSNGDSCSSTCQVTVPQPSPGMSVSDVTVVEGNSGTKLANFTVNLTAASASPVTFDISTEPGTAAPGVDYSSQSLGGQSIAAGQTSFNFAVTVNGDTEVEDNESFTVNLNNALGAVLLDAQAKGIIGNDDTAVLSIADATQAEGNSATSGMVFVVSLSSAQPTAVSFNIATSDGSATAGSDYAARSQVGRTIDAGRTSARFEVAINGDTSAEANESLNVTLSAVAGATLGDGTATGTIVNDEPTAQVSISAIQGNAVTSPLVGKQVATEGIITAITSDGFYLQSLPGQDDADRQSSEGVLVSVDPRSLQVGDLARAAGRVEEFFAGGDEQWLGVTRIAADRISILANGQPLPQPVLLDSRDLSPAQSISALEKYEGMRVRLEPVRVVAASGSGTSPAPAKIESEQLFQAVMEGVARPFLEPLFDGNPERIAIDSVLQRGAAALIVDGGDIVSDLRGVLDYSRSSYRVLLDADGAPSVLGRANPRPVSIPSRFESTIASVQLPALPVRPASRRAAPARWAEFDLRISKIADVIQGYLHKPDIVVVFGATNVDTLSDLAAVLNEKPGADYRVQALRVAPDRAFLVSTKLAQPGVDRVEVRSLSRANGSGDFDGSRAGVESAPTLLAVRLHRSAGSTLDATVVASRFARLGSARDEIGARPQGHGITRTQTLRLAQAQALAKLLQQRQRENVIVLGDFDAPEFSDGDSDLVGLLSDRPSAGRRLTEPSGSPVRPLLTNLTAQLPADERYDEIRDGNAQLRSHVLVNTMMLSASPRMHVEPARVNADFASDNRDDALVPLQSGRSDPLVLFVELD